MKNELAMSAVVNAAAGVGKAIDDFEKACAGLYAVNSTKKMRHKARGDLFEAIDKYVESLQTENFGESSTPASVLGTSTHGVDTAAPDAPRAHELRVFKVLDPRRNEMLYFVRLKDAIDTAENCSMIYQGTALMHTGHPMPNVIGWISARNG